MRLHYLLRNCKFHLLYPHIPSNEQNDDLLNLFYSLNYSPLAKIAAVESCQFLTLRMEKLLACSVRSDHSRPLFIVPNLDNECLTSYLRLSNLFMILVQHYGILMGFYSAAVICRIKKSRRQPYATLCSPNLSDPNSPNDPGH